LACDIPSEEPNESGSVGSQFKLDSQNLALQSLVKTGVQWSNFDLS